MTEFQLNAVLWKIPNGYPEQTPKNQLSAIFTSVDPNANTYVYKNTDGTAKGSKKEASYTVKNLTGTLDAVVTAPGCTTRIPRPATSIRWTISI